MKIKYLLSALPLMLCTTLFTACPTDDVEKDGSSTDGGGNNGGGTDEEEQIIIVGDGTAGRTEMSPEDQKEYLEDVAQVFMNAIPSTDFDVYCDLANFCSEEFGDECDWDSVEDWADDAWDALLVKKGTNSESGSDDWCDWVEHYTNFDALIAASNFTGHFTYSRGSWKRTDASDLQFTFTDDKGKKCVASLTTIGGKNVHLGYIVEDETDYHYNSYYDGSYRGLIERSYDRYNVTIKVPSSIIVTVTQDGKQLVKSTVDIDLNSLKGSEFTSASSLSLTSQTELSNGYKFNVSQCKYNAGKSVSVNCSLSNKKGTLFTGGVSGDIANLPDVNLSEAADLYTTIFDDGTFDSTTGQLTYAKVSILSAVQLQGTISDVHKYVDYLDAADEAYENRNEMQSWLNKANRLASINLYYNGTSVKQASMSLEAVSDGYDSWSGTTYYETVPVLNFSDGSRYSTFDDFFNEDDFSVTIRIFKNLANKYADLLDDVDRPY